jgi:hypothetical protein
MNVPTTTTFITKTALHCIDYIHISGKNYSFLAAPVFF